MRKSVILCLGLTLWVLFLPMVNAEPVFGPPKPAASMPSRENCFIYQFRVNDPEPPLNIRSSPEIRSDNIIGNLPNGRIGTILSEQNGWLKISWTESAITREGWIVANRADYDCNAFIETISTYPYQIEGRLIGGGSHQYAVDLHKGQTLVLRPERQNRPQHSLYWPSAVTGPDIAERMDGVPNAYGYWWRKPGDTTTPEPAEWRWTATVGGRYIIDYDSNFKGFVYGPCVLTVE